MVEARTRRALQAAQKYSLVANSVKSEIVIEPEIIVADMLDTGISAMSEGNPMETAEATVTTRITPVRSLPVGTTKRARTLWLIGGTALILVFVAIALLPPQVPVVHVSTETVRDEAAGTGFARAKVTIGVGAKINGIVLKTYGDQGDVIKKGQIMAELQGQDVQSQIGQAVNQAQAQGAALISARANLAASRARLQASVSAVAKAEAGLRLAEISFCTRALSCASR